MLKIGKKDYGCSASSNVHTNVRVNRLCNTNLNLVTPIRPTRQRGDFIKPTDICLKEEGKLQATFCQSAVQNMCTVNISNHQVKTKICHQFAVWNFSTRHCSRM